MAALFSFYSTGKRNITGMMNDASNSLARMYLNTVKDFWRQATIDYILGKGLEGSWWAGREEMQEARLRRTIVALYLGGCAFVGYHKIEIFRHVPQSTLMSAEPGMERRWAKIRMDASKLLLSVWITCARMCLIDNARSCTIVIVEISSAIVIADDEIRLGGWTLLSPNEPQKR